MALVTARNVGPEMDMGLSSAYSGEGGGLQPGCKCLYWSKTHKQEMLACINEVNYDALGNVVRVRYLLLICIPLIVVQQE